MRGKYTRLSRTFKRFWERHYKGLSDLISAALFLTGAIFTSLGTMFLLCAEYISVFYLIFGCIGIFASYDLFRYGRE
jgi:hypothetical protein